MNLYVQETYIDRTRNCRFGESEVYESFTDKPGELYRSCQREYGRCVSRVYINRTDGPPKAIGWVFVGRQKYEDSPETYLREVWITVHTEQPTKHQPTYHYADL